MVTVLADGSYLSRLSPPRKEVRAGAAPIIVRVVEYHLLATDGTPTETFALISTLLDVEAAPAAELAELYHARWQIENAFGAFKSQLKGNGVVLRSKTPDGAEQELWALLCAYHAIRELICAAAELTDQDPLRLSFIAALDAVRGPVGDPAAFSPLTTHPVTSPPRGCTSSPPCATPAGSADPTHAKPNRATPTRANEPTPPCGHGPVDPSPSSCYPSPFQNSKLKVLRPTPPPDRPSMT